MANLSAVVRKLNDMGYSVSTDWHEKYVKLWEKWYKGYDEDFHKSVQVGPDNSQNEIDIASMKMAKTVCEDWASLLLSEKTAIVIDDPASDEFIQGKKDDQMQGGVFGETNFWVHANELVERTFALGLGAFVPRISAADYEPEIIRDEKTGESIKTGAGRLTGGKIAIDFITAESIIPLVWENREIKECAFVTEQRTKDGDVVIVQIHKPGSVTFHWYKETSEGLELIQIPSDYVAEVQFEEEGLFLPVFIRPQLSNHLDPHSPFGISVYSQAIDILKGCDLAYDNFISDIELGRKMVFMREELFGIDAEGRKIAPQKTRRRLFQSVGEGIPGADETPFIHEYNPNLRTEENERAVQAQLNYLSFKTGLGMRYYTFNQGSVQTATQIVSENSPLYRNRQKHCVGIEKALIDVTRNILYLGKQLGAPVNPQTSITVIFDDSIITDKEAERMRFLREIQDGVRQKWEYRKEFFGESEEEAKAMCPEPAPITDRFSFGQKDKEGLEVE